MYKIIISIALLSALTSCGNDTSETTTKTATEKNDTAPNMSETENIPELIREDVDADKFKNLMSEEGAIILDVRTPEEFSEGHIDGAININFYGDNFEEKLDSLAKDKNVMVYCMAGGRSGKTSRLLNDKGFSKVYNLENGFGNYPYQD